MISRAIIFYLLFQVSIQNDPLKDFCRLFGHQTALVDRQLYIDGGFVQWSPITANPTNYTDTWLRRGDLNVSNQGFPQEVTLAKNDSVPSVVGGVLWPDTANKLIYLYGGAYGNGTPEPFQIWAYDIIANSWSAKPSNGTVVSRASWGAGVTAQDKALGYYYGGWLTNDSVPDYAPKTALNTMLIYDMLANSFQNASGPDFTPRAEGAMVYLPVGDSGLLVYFGGIQLPYGNSTIEGVPLTDIFLFSIGDNRWYQEKATGDIPDKRRRFCAGVAWSNDRTSYNIYIYGGASIGNGPGFGDVYVLSLPSFKWIKFYSSSDTGWDDKSTKHSTTCDVINNSQMIIMGGLSTQSTDCDEPNAYGQHGLDLGKANSNGAKWAIFNASLTTYKVPPEITATIGGGGTGGATASSPTSGWSNTVLKANFQKSYTPSTRAATRALTANSVSTTPTSSEASTSSPEGSSRHHHHNHKAVIGGAVGGAIGALLVLSALGAGLRFARRRRRKQTEEEQTQPPQELPSERPMSELPPETKDPIPDQWFASWNSSDSHAQSTSHAESSVNAKSLPPQELEANESPVHARSSSQTQSVSMSPESSHTDPWFAKNPPKP